MQCIVAVNRVGGQCTGAESEQQFDQLMSARAWSCGFVLEQPQQGCVVVEVGGLHTGAPVEEQESGVDIAC